MTSSPPLISARNKARGNLLLGAWAGAGGLWATWHRQSVPHLISQQWSAESNPPTVKQLYHIKGRRTSPDHSTNPAHGGTRKTIVCFSPSTASPEIARVRCPLQARKWRRTRSPANIFSAELGTGRCARRSTTENAVRCGTSLGISPSSSGSASSTTLWIERPRTRPSGFKITWIGCEAWMLKGLKGSG